MQLEARRSVTLLAGLSGSGKSTFAFRYLVADAGLSCRYVFDADSEASRRLGLPPAESPEECVCAADDGFVIFDPHRLWPGNLSGAFDWFCGWCFAHASATPGRKVLLVDEAWRYCAPNTIPAPLSACLQTGRKAGLGMMFATQRPNRLNEAITNETTELVCFRLQGENALKRVASLGADTDEVSGLAPGQFVAVNCETGGELRGRLW